MEIRARAELPPWQVGREKSMAKGEVFRTREGSFRVLVEQVIDGKAVDWHLADRRDIESVRAQVGDEEAVRLFGDGKAEVSGIQAHAYAVKEWVGKAVNWTGERTDTGFEFVVAK